ncbi:MAG: NAD(P)H-dependent oxidoreductase subunit E [Bacteroidales bacterium]
MAVRHEMEICLGSSCFSRGNKEIVHYIREWLKKNHIDDKVVFRGARCFGNCSNGPNLKINGRKFESLQLSMIEKILEEEFGDLK